MQWVGGPPQAPAHSERLGAQDEHGEHKKCRIRLVKAALANGLRDVDESIIGLHNAGARRNAVCEART